MQFSLRGPERETEHMELDKKVIAAIGTAVTAYVQSQRAAEQAARTRRSRPVVNVWNRSGREEIMRNRQMWQIRIVPK